MSFPVCSRRRFLTIVGTAFLGAFAGESRSTPVSPGLRVMSFNIRNSGAKDGEDHWEHRKELFVATIREFDPDLLGTQEVLADQFDALGQLLPEYVAVGVAREDGARKGEWAAIFYRRSRFEQLDTGNFWLSQTPDVVGSISWDAACVRICTWARLRDRVSGKEFLFANTHFDHQGRVARIEAAKILRQRLPVLAKGSPVILSGDFNCTEDDEAYRTLVHAPRDAGVPLFDCYRELHLERSKDEATFHAFKGAVTGSRIDWILHSEQFKATGAEIVRKHGTHYPSDHFAVTATLTLE